MKAIYMAGEWVNIFLIVNLSWLKNDDKFEVNSIRENSSKGYILEVDFEYSDESHYLPNDYPLAPEKIEISYDTLSNYMINKYDNDKW